MAQAHARANGESTLYGGGAKRGKSPQSKALRARHTSPIRMFQMIHT